MLIRFHSSLPLYSQTTHGNKSKCFLTVNREPTTVNGYQYILSPKSKGDNPVRLQICHPSEIFMNTAVKKIVAESPRGSFCILPRHIDTVMALVPGILAYFNDAGEESFLAINGGIMIKQEDKVFIATRMAIKGELGTLKKKVEEFMDKVDEKERETLSSLARLEADFIHRFLEIGKNV